MADLTKAFDFANPDYSIPSMPNASYPSTNEKGVWNGYAVCESTWQVRRPPVPYGKQTEKTSLVAEEGFKLVRGELTEGRSLVFEVNGYALASSQGRLIATKSTANHESEAQRFIIYGNTTRFSVQSATSETFITNSASLETGSPSSADMFTITDLGNGNGHTIQTGNGLYLSIDGNGDVKTSKLPDGFTIYSVT